MDASQPASLDAALATAQTLITHLRKAVLGRDLEIERLVMALLSGGHVLLEDLPGSGKTTLARTLGEAILDDRAQDAKGNIHAFRRIQFTPDMLPSDITGTTIFDPGTASFHFQPGPIFTRVLLADEINRTSPKVQSAMLEAMAESQVTVDNKTWPLDPLFFVVATQNPLDLAGTFPLPVAQLDRFLFKLRMEPIAREFELQVLATLRERRHALPSGVVGASAVLAARSAMEQGVTVHPAIHEALVDAAQTLRKDRRVLQGVSTRALVLCVPALQARALLKGRDVVTPEDVEDVVPLVFGHRVQLAGGAQDARSVILDGLRPALQSLSRALLRGRG